MRKWEKKIRIFVLAVFMYVQSIVAGRFTNRRNDSGTKRLITMCSVACDMQCDVVIIGLLS